MTEALVHRVRLAHGELRAAAMAAALIAASSVPSAGAEPMSRVERRGSSFVCGGEPFAVVGFNCYYLMAYAADPGLRDEVDEVLREARALGSTVIRTWAFGDGDRWNALQVAPGVYDERVFVGLDYVVHRASREGLRVLLPLVNNWPDYGGMDQYVAWSATAVAHDDFYTDPETRGRYRDHAARVLGRINTFSGLAYRDDPAIFGWELVNEPRAAAKGPAILQAWVAAMAAHLKSLDPHHLVSTGSEGFYGPASDGNPPGASWMRSQGVDFIADHAIPGIDFASFHAWPDSWSLADDPAATATWVRRHLSDARDVLGKPVLLGEFGKRQPVATRDAWFGTCYDELLDALEPGAARAGMLCWILYDDAYPDYDGYGVYFPAARHASTVELIQESHRRIRERVAGSPLFVRGDATCDGELDISDPIAVILALFATGPPPCCAEAADANDDDRLDLADAIYSLAFTFTGGPAPPRPFPACGSDPTAAAAPLECARDSVCSP